MSEKSILCESLIKTRISNLGEWMDNQFQRKAKLESKESQQLKIPQNNLHF